MDSVSRPQQVVRPPLLHLRLDPAAAFGLPGDSVSCPQQVAMATAAHLRFALIAIFKLPMDSVSRPQQVVRPHLLHLRLDVVSEYGHNCTRGAWVAVATPAHLCPDPAAECRRNVPPGTWCPVAPLRLDLIAISKLPGGNGPQHLHLRRNPAAEYGHKCRPGAGAWLRRLCRGRSLSNRISRRGSLSPRAPGFRSPGKPRAPP